MRFQRILNLLAVGGLISLAGCEPPRHGEYNYGANDGPTYDAQNYMTKTSPEFYDASYYHDKRFEGHR